MSNQRKKKKITRREFIKSSVRLLAIFSVGGLTAISASNLSTKETVWQIDPYKCVQCGKCATNCVQDFSVVKCVHAFAVCGYCELCSGYFNPGTKFLNTGAENQLCPTNAIKRTFIEDPFYEYTIDENLCIGCGKCVKGCEAFGNGSLFLQIRHDRCFNCNECLIAMFCPSNAVTRVRSDKAYILKTIDPEGSDG